MVIIIISINQDTEVTSILWGWSQALANWDGCDRKGIWHYILDFSVYLLTCSVLSL